MAPPHPENQSARLPLREIDLEIAGDPTTVVVPKVKLREVVYVELAEANV